MENKLPSIIENLQSEFKQNILNDVAEIAVKGRDSYREGADSVVIDLNWKGRLYVGKKLLFRPDATVEDMSHVLTNFYKEIKLLSEMNHENIVPFVGVYYCRTDGSFDYSFLLPVVVMEKMLFSLTKYIDTFQRIPEADIINILCDVARGLIYLHEDKMVIHGDLCSNNILFASNFCVKIADFRSVQSLDKPDGWHAASTQLGLQFGTIDFMPPEALMDSPCYTVSLDVFSFGCVTIHLTTCKWPTPVGKIHETGELERRLSLVSMMSDFPVLLPIVEKCLEDKEKRPACRDLFLSLADVNIPKE